MVLEADVELEIAEWNPAALAAPATMHDALLVRHQLPECCHRLWRRLLLELGDELQRASNRDFDL
ncbi:hypothetical protein D3C83_223330 [compost metagenome]